MEVILKEKINKLGNIGDIIKVKNGFAKNFLIPSNKAIYANEKNKKIIEDQKSILEHDNAKKLEEAKNLASNYKNKTFIFIRNSGENGQLYGSVSTKDITNNLLKANIKITPHQVKLKNAIKYIGIYEAIIELHPDINLNIYIIVARTNDEAEQLFKTHNNKLDQEAKKKQENISINN